MKLTRFTREQIIEARDTCGVPSLYFAAGLLDRSTRKTPIFRVCLRVKKLPDGLTRRGNIKVRPNPFARARSINSVWLDNPTSLGPYVNWDGHFKFIARLFELNPDGRVESSRYSEKRVVYRGEVDFYFKCSQTKSIMVAYRTPVFLHSRDVMFGEL